VGEVIKLKFEEQFYKNISLRLIKREYRFYKAKRYLLNNTNQNVWIPNKHLFDDGTIRQNDNIDYVFRNAYRKLRLAGYSDKDISVLGIYIPICQEKEK
jgi:hypothetical protein